MGNGGQSLLTTLLTTHTYFSRKLKLSEGCNVCQDTKSLSDSLYHLYIGFTYGGILKFPEHRTGKLQGFQADVQSGWNYSSST